MSDEEITIKISLEDARLLANNTLSQGVGSRLASVCNNVLDARQTLYEKWMHGRLPLYIDCDNNAIDAEGDQFPWPGIKEDAMLVAAAPQMLDALIKIERETLRWLLGVEEAHESVRDLKGGVGTVVKAIRAALPDDVADEVLG